jgi:hypothetical protein
MTENNETIDFSISIFPKEREAKVLFSSKEEKEDYVLKEWNYCRKSRNEYVTCPVSKIKESKKEYEDQKVLFAKKMGYGPQKNNINVWVKQQQKVDPSNEAA